MTGSALLVCSSEAEGPVSVAHNRPLVECIWVPNYLVSFWQCVPRLSVQIGLRRLNKVANAKRLVEAAVLWVARSLRWQSQKMPLPI